MLADPDVIANHGLAREGNAALALALIKALRRGDGNVVFDETVHGIVVRPVSPFLLLFRFPFVVATVQGVLAVALLLWATLGRFGAPQSGAAGAAAPDARASCENMAKLVEFTGHQDVMVKRYVQETVRDAALALHAPRELSGAGLVAWLQRVGSARGVAIDCEAVLQQAADAGTAAGETRRRWCGWRAIFINGRERSSMDVHDIRAITEAVRGEVRKAVVGQDAIIDLMLTSLLVGGHILLEGVPGTAKTLLTRAFAAGLALQFGRIQFTPDLMPGDVLGTNLFNFQTNSFILTKGPIFTQLLLADEINRTPPKTQAALLQAMNERVVTIDGKDYPLGEDFMVVATQNPIEQQGTYPLPEAQLDRFLFKMIIDYPSRDEEREIVRRHGHRSAMPRLEDFGLKAVADGSVLAQARETVTQIRLSDPLDRLHRRRDPGHPRAFLARGRRLDARRQHAGRRRARLRGAAGPRFRDPGRREVPGLAGAAASPHAVAGRGDRGPHRRPDPARDHRPDAGAAMIRPTARMVLIFVGGIPLALFVVIYDPALWPLSFNYGVLVAAGGGERLHAGAAAARARGADRHARPALDRRARRRHRHPRRRPRYRRSVAASS